MFNQKELTAEAPLYTHQPVPFMETIIYGENDFHGHRRDGQIINIHRGLKRNYHNSIHFCVSSLRLFGLSDFGISNYGSYTVFVTLNEQQFKDVAASRFLEGNESIKNPYTLIPKGKFITALQLEDSFYECSVIAEFEHEYISFHWLFTE